MLKRVQHGYLYLAYGLANSDNGLSPEAKLKALKPDLSRCQLISI